jgi:hypothetical protein
MPNFVLSSIPTLWMASGNEPILKI